MNPAEENAWLRAAVTDELVALWSDFDQAVRYAARPPVPAHPESWSINMHWIAERIEGLTVLVGSPRWQDVQVHLLLDGWWDAVHAAAGLEAPPFDRARAQAVRDRRVA